MQSLIKTGEEIIGIGFKFNQQLAFNVDVRTLGVGVLKEREPKNRSLTARLAATRGTGVSTSASASIDAAIMTSSATGAADSAAGGSTATATAKPVTGVIPPRPRKQGKKR